MVMAVWLSWPLQWKILHCRKVKPAASWCPGDLAVQPTALGHQAADLSTRAHLDRQACTPLRNCDARGVKPMVDHELSNSAMYHVIACKSWRIIIPDRVPGARWDFRVDTQQQILTRGFSFLSSKRNHTNFSTRKRGIGLSGKGSRTTSIENWFMLNNGGSQRLLCTNNLRFCILKDSCSLFPRAPHNSSPIVQSFTG